MFKLILLDFCLEDMDGPQIYKRIKEMLQKEGLKTPFVCCCTAYTEPVFEQQALQAGMDRFLAKPI